MLFMGMELNFFMWFVVLASAYSFVLKRLVSNNDKKRHLGDNSHMLYDIIKFEYYF